MKKIKINSVEYNVPENWGEVTLKQLMTVMDDSKLIKNESLKKLSLISGYGNIPLEVIKHLTLKETEKLVSQLSFIAEPLPTKPITEFEFKENKYYVMPTLMKAEFQDFVNLETALQNFKDEQHKALPYVLAILCKRENETLDSFDLEDRAKLFEELPLTIVEPIRVFFYSIGTLSQIHSQLSSMEGMEAQINAKAKLLENFLNAQVGLGFLMKLLRGILVRWIKFLNRKSKKFFNSIRSKS